LAIQARDWPTAAEALKEMLTEQPAHPEWLLLAGIVHDRWGLNRPEEAIGFYQKLYAYRQGIPDNNGHKPEMIGPFDDKDQPRPKYPQRDVAFTGLYWSMQCYFQQQDYQRVVELAEILEKEFAVSVNTRALYDMRNWATKAQAALFEKPGK
jgi:hypothetical protein